MPSTKDNTEKVFDLKAETDYDTVLQPALHQVVTLFQIYLSTNKLIYIYIYIYKIEWNVPNCKTAAWVKLEF